MTGGRFGRDIALSQYFDEVQMPQLLEHAAAALAVVRPKDPVKFLARHFAGCSDVGSLPLQQEWALPVSVRYSVVREEEQTSRGLVESEAAGERAGLAAAMRSVGEMISQLKMRRRPSLSPPGLDLMPSFVVDTSVGELKKKEKGDDDDDGRWNLGYESLHQAGRSLSVDLQADRQGTAPQPVSVVEEFIGIPRFDEEPTLSAVQRPQSMRTPRAQELLGRAHTPADVELPSGSPMFRKHVLALPATGGDVELCADTVAQYHRTLRRLDEIKCMRDAVLNPAGNLWWDGRRAVPGREWVDRMPDEIRQRVGRPFTPDEVASIERDCRLHTASSVPGRRMPKVLYIIGPAGAGKTTIRPHAEKLLGINLSNYVEIDGDDIRNHHGAWQEVLADQWVGYRDAMSVLSKPVEAVKDSIVTRAVAQRKNLVISQTGQNTMKFEREMKRMHLEFGYVIDMVGLVVSMHEAGVRAINRSHENGRWHEPSWDKWNSVMKSIRFLMSENRCDNCIVFDNENFDEPQTIYTRTHNPRYVDGVIEKYRRRDGDPAGVSPASSLSLAVSP
eukprot:TRINITY_DN13765_c0_g1_i1.p1 TRINITY_DN13765_c0_g1~~TRINITY_DN13765_c0_g1_i1.p1  ORF type:complete len:578 (+),score=91.88 TRINITY_DN13765_c0_g1_i1:58-1734(+)